MWSCESTIQVAALVIHFTMTGIVEVWTTGPSTCFINHKLYRLLFSIVLSTCSPISGWNLVWKRSRSGGHSWCDKKSACEWLLTWYLYIRSFCSGSPLVFHSRCKQHSPQSGKTTNIWICPMSTSDIPCSTQAPVSTSNVPSTRAWASAADTILPSVITSGSSDAADGWQCDPWFQRQAKAIAEVFTV